MTKRKASSLPAFIEDECAIAPSSPKRTLTSWTRAAISLLSLKSDGVGCEDKSEKLSTDSDTLPEQADYKSGASSITDDEEEIIGDSCRKIVRKKRSLNASVCSITPPVKQALVKPRLLLHTKKVPALHSLPEGRPLPPAPLLPSVMYSRDLKPLSNKL